MTVYQYHALKDNYNWIIICPETNKCAGVDILDSDHFIEYVNKNNLNPVAILNTHHHSDHTGGNIEIGKYFKNISFCGSKFDFEHKRIQCQTDFLSDGDTLKVGNIKISVLETPGHTLGHLCFYSNEFAFVGDTLFVSGCGRLFEGTPKQMFDSLGKIIGSVAPDIPIYCGHEYTLSNLKFACSLNEDYFKPFYFRAEQLLRKNSVTVPTSIKVEMEANPFLLVRDNNFRKEIFGLGNYNAVDGFAIIRKKKDCF